MWSAAEIDAIEQYLAKIPAPDEQATLMLAQLCAMFANVHRDKGRSYEPMDFMPWAKPPAPIMSEGDYNEHERKMLTDAGFKLQ